MSKRGQSIVITDKVPLWLRQEYLRQAAEIVFDVHKARREPPPPTKKSGV